MFQLSIFVLVPSQSLSMFYIMIPPKVYVSVTFVSVKNVYNTGQMIQNLTDFTDFIGKFGLKNFD